jgi:hypothetical protein
MLEKLIWLQLYTNMYTKPLTLTQACALDSTQAHQHVHHRWQSAGDVPERVGLPTTRTGAVQRQRPRLRARPALGRTPRSQQPRVRSSLTPVCADKAVDLPFFNNSGRCVDTSAEGSAAANSSDAVKTPQ